MSARTAMKKPPSTKVMEIFSEAAGIPAAGLLDFLDRACAGDGELRAEIESLLDTNERVGGFLDAPTVPGPGGDGTANLPDLLESDRVLVGRYRIVERIGEGGFGVVYHARQDQPIRRDVALKIVKLGMDTRQVIARFQSERQTLAMMEHPNIARIFDAGATPEGRPYFVMELVSGLPVTEYCDSHRLPLPQRLDLFMAVCDAVQHAHQKGIIHRDLKPSNILIAGTDGAAAPKIIDFGIAKALEARPGAQTTADAHRFIGTPQYMSPEQAGAGDGSVDTRSDIYSLGVLLYELLTGVTPFDPQALRQGSYEQVQRILREDDPPTPTARLTTVGPALAQIADQRRLDTRNLCRAAAGELGWIAMKALEKDPRERYQTVSALSDDVRRFLAQEPLAAGPPNTLYRVRKFTRRHRRSLLVAAALTLALLLGLAGTTFGLIRAKRDRDRANVALAQAEQIGAFLSDMLRSADPDRARGKQVLVRDVIDRTSKSLDEGALRNQPLVEAGIRMALGGSYESLGLYPEAEAQFRVALEIRRRLLGNDNLQTAQSMIGLAAALSNRYQLDASEDLLRQALAIQERELGPHSAQLVPTLSTLGPLLRTKGDTLASEAVMRRALGIARKNSPRGEETAMACTNLAVTLLDERKYDEAESLFTEAIAIDRKLHGDLFRNVPRNLGNLGVIRNARGDLKGAESKWLEALRLQRQILPADHPDIGWTLRQLGEVKAVEGDLPASEKYFRQSLDMERKLFGPRHPMVLDITDEFCDVLEREGKRQEARELGWDALQKRLSRQTAVVASHPQDVGAYADLADLHVRAGDFRKAADDLNRAVALNPTNQWYWFELACLRLELGDDAGYRDACHRMLDPFTGTNRPELSERLAKVCLLSTSPVGDVNRLDRLADQAVAAGGPYVAWFQFCKGLARYRLGDYSAAREWFGKAAGLRSSWGTPTVHLMAAVTDYKLHRADAPTEYRAVLDEIEKLPRPGKDDLGSGPQNYLVLDVLLREAAATIGPPPATQPAR